MCGSLVRFAEYEITIAVTEGSWKCDVNRHDKKPGPNAPRDK
ncbi:hypothetical protein FTUN_3896 [Frigoriglobus tundricola]|uniref:Uncharacterized protein n=1 Tax=Frigoriglobus tundricola TaxID=2774151 RepID=A0A6M5YQS1_9BACT|nr:hypothetical protein FTUN_3896 [Frigoriglobus tundricola]